MGCSKMSLTKTIFSSAGKEIGEVSIAIQEANRKVGFTLDRLTDRIDILKRDHGFIDNKRNEGDRYFDLFDYPGIEETTQFTHQYRGQYGYYDNARIITDLAYTYIITEYTEPMPGRRWEIDNEWELIIASPRFTILSGRHTTAELLVFRKRKGY